MHGVEHVPEHGPHLLDELLGLGVDVILPLLAGEHHGDLALRDLGLAYAEDCLLHDLHVLLVVCQDHKVQDVLELEGRQRLGALGVGGQLPEHLLEVHARVRLHFHPADVGEQCNVQPKLPSAVAAIHRQEHERLPCIAHLEEHDWHRGSEGENDDGVQPHEELEERPGTTSDEPPTRSLHVGVGGLDVDPRVAEQLTVRVAVAVAAAILVAAGAVATAPNGGARGGAEPIQSPTTRLLDAASAVLLHNGEHRRLLRRWLWHVSGRGRGRVRIEARNGDRRPVDRIPLPGYEEDARHRQAACRSEAEHVHKVHPLVLPEEQQPLHDHQDRRRRKGRRDEEAAVEVADPVQHDHQRDQAKQ
mmetsp:Transcript_94987/g.252249  ORF Transcript_94987/g.252249 Transcript_94987/m.252249 type:complete len:360 (-) Transcript_94987:501-1580(-)